MEYMTDREHLEWKIRKTREALEDEIPFYRQTLKLTSDPHISRADSR
jgi:hypothetical protein